MPGSINFKTPPVWADDMSFDTWKAEIEVWKLVTELSESKRGPAIALSLTGAKRESVMSIPTDDLKANDGLDKVIAKLESCFGKEQFDQTYMDYEKFENIHRNQNKPMQDYIIDFEQAYERMKKHSMTLPDIVLACKLLYRAGLEDRDKQIVLSATSDLKYANMKTSLKRIFGSVKASNIDQKPLSNIAPQTLKEEPAFTASGDEQSVFWTGRGRQSNGFRGRSRYGRGGRSFRGSSSTAESTVAKGKNPVGKDGKVFTCHTCGSRNHFARDCPDREVAAISTADATEESETYITFALITGNLLQESFGCAIIDTACTTTVAGDAWMENFISGMPKHEQNCIIWKPARKWIVFGGGERQYAESQVDIPIAFGDLNCMLRVLIIAGKLPLLLSLQSMVRAGMVLDTPSKCIRIHGVSQNVPLRTATTGHLIIDIKRPISDSFCWLTNSRVIDEKAIVKLHRQFGHCSGSRLLELLKSSKFDTSNVSSLIENVSEKCTVCQQYGRSKPKPASCKPLSTEWNGVVALDLHQLTTLGSNLWYLHIIDLYTRFSVCTLVHNKHPSTIVSAFLQKWCLLFGVPKETLTDNGGEFDNDLFRTMAESYDIKTRTTAAYSPWSNGIIERHNQVVTDVFLKLLEDKTLVLPNEVILNYAVFAKNSLLNKDGFSPYQLVFGQNPNLPTVFTNKLPALEARSTSESVAQHLQALNMARHLFMESENSNRIRRALRHNVVADDGPYETGDEVYYKRECDGSRWRGPAKVIGQDGSTIFVRHGGSAIKVHRIHLKRCHNVEVPREHAKDLPTHRSVTAEANQKNATADSAQGAEDLDSTSDSEESSVSFTPGVKTECEKLQHEQIDSNDTITRISTVPQQTETTTGVRDVSDVLGNLAAPKPRKDALPSIPKKNQLIKFSNENGDTCEAVVIGRAGKSTGIHKDWINVNYLSPENLKEVQGCIDLRQCNDWTTIDEPTESAALSTVTQSDNFHAAKVAELASWAANDVYTEVHDEGQDYLTLRWVLTEKEDRLKARLCVRGFEDPDYYNVVKDSPTCNRESFRVLLSLCVFKGWEAHTMDVRTAFLQGESLLRTVHVKPPLEANSDGRLWLLKRCVYGLVDAARHWYERVKREILSTGCIVSKFDPCVFFLVRNKELIGLISTHVDDFWWAGDGLFEHQCIQHLHHVFDIRSAEIPPFRYLGLDVYRDRRTLVIDQSKYAEKLEEIVISDKLDLSRSTTKKEKSEMRSKLGKIQWVVGQTRPDLSFEVNALLSVLPSSTLSDMLKVNKVIRKIKYSTKDCKVMFPDLGPTENWQLHVYSDASLCNLHGEGTQGGYLVFLIGRNRKCSLVAWKSNKLRRIVRSTICAETLACVEGIEAALVCQNLIKEVLNAAVPITAFTDNFSLVESVYSTKAANDKRLRVEITYLRSMIENKELEKLEWIKGESQVADCLTKCNGNSAKALLQVIRSSSF